MTIDVAAYVGLASSAGAQPDVLERTAPSPLPVRGRLLPWLREHRRGGAPALFAGHVAPKIRAASSAFVVKSRPSLYMEMS